MTKTTRCKMSCQNVSEQRYSKEAMPMHSATFAPVYSNDPESENAKFWAATPSGKLEVACTKEQFFVAGSEYYIDITLAE